MYNGRRPVPLFPRSGAMLSQIQMKVYPSASLTCSSEPKCKHAHGLPQHYRQYIPSPPLSDYTSLSAK